MRACNLAGFLSVFLAMVCPTLAAQTTPSIFLFSLEDKGVPTGTVHSYSVNSSSGALTEVPGSPFNAGLTPIQLAVDPSGRFVYVANSQSDDITAFSVDASTGTLTPLPGSPFPIGTQPSGQQPIALAIDPTGRFLYVSTDTNIGGEVPDYNVYEYTIDSLAGVLTAAAGSPVVQGICVGSMSFDPGGNYAYVGQAGGLPDSDLPILVYAVDFSSGMLTPVGSVEPADEIGGQSETIVDPSGKFLYSVNIGGEEGELGAFTIDSENGLAAEISGSSYTVEPIPYNLAINPLGNFIYVVNINSQYQTTSTPSEYDGTVAAFLSIPRLGR